MSLTILFVIYLFIGLIIGILAGIMFFGTLGGTGYAATGADPTFYINLMDFVSIYFSSLKYSIYYLYYLFLIWLVRAIYINYLTYIELSNKPIPIEK